jgi:hypothetical protein
MQLEVYREGRAGFHVGDTIDVPDDVEFFDGIHLRPVEVKPEEKPAPVTASKSAAKKEGS